MNEFINLQSNFPIAAKFYLSRRAKGRVRSNQWEEFHILPFQNPKNAFLMLFSSGPCAGAMYVNAHAHVCIVGGC